MLKVSTKAFNSNQYCVFPEAIPFIKPIINDYRITIQGRERQELLSFKPRELSILVDASLITRQPSLLMPNKRLAWRFIRVFHPSISSYHRLNLTHTVIQLVGKSLPSYFFDIY